MYALLATTLLAACGSKPAADTAARDTAAAADDSGAEAGSPDGEDDDGDGYIDRAFGGDDCDDGDPGVNPGATELCNGVDDDCDGVIDPDSSADAPSWSVDGDGDGYGDVDSKSFTACEGAEGLADRGGDCDDRDPAVNPGAEEICDEIDNNCDAQIDEGFEDAYADWYADADSDGYGDPDSEPVNACAAPEGAVDNDLDCDDDDPERFEDCANGPVLTEAVCTSTLYFWAEEGPEDPELHIFGVYEGDGGHGGPAGTTTVRVERETELTLVLSSYEPVHWEVEIAEGAALREVILNGYNQHTADVPEGVTVTDYSGVPGYLTACAYVWPYSTGGCDTPGLVGAAERLTGQPLTSFTGCYHGTSYTLK